MTTTVTPRKQCPTCGKPLPQGSPAGLCPSCLLAQGAETEPGGPEPRTGFEPPALEEVAALFPQLEVISFLGAGGMGAVYKARQPALDRFVALKLLPKDGVEGNNFAERGRFRAFLLASLKHFLANEWDKSQRQKRGGGALHLSLDWQDADDRYHLEPVDPANPERAFDREWALALLQHVIERLQAECIAEGKARLFESAKDFLTAGRDAIPYAEAARTAGMDEGALRVAVHRLRKRYRELLRDEIAQTLADPAQADDELRSLMTAMA